MRRFFYGANAKCKFIQHTKIGLCDQKLLADKSVQNIIFRLKMKDPVIHIRSTTLHRDAFTRKKSFYIYFYSSKIQNKIKRLKTKTIFGAF